MSEGGDGVAYFFFIVGDTSVLLPVLPPFIAIRLGYTGSFEVTWNGM